MTTPPNQLPERTATFDPTDIALPPERPIADPNARFVEQEADTRGFDELIAALSDGDRGILPGLAASFQSTTMAGIRSAYDPSYQMIPVRPVPPAAVAESTETTLTQDMAALNEAYARATARTIPRPTSWDDIIGNTRAIAQIREAIDAAKAQEIPLQHMLLFGPPGVGKSTISKMIARDMNSGCLETTASTLEQPKDVLRVCHAMNNAREKTGNPSVLFVDEIHMLGNSRGRSSIDQESIYPLLEDWVFYHNLQGKKVKLADDDERSIDRPEFLVWPFTCIGATTDAGLLSQALQRRFLIQIELEPYTVDNIAEIILRAGRRMTAPVTEDAAAELARYARLNPGRAFSLLAHARNKMYAERAEAITFDVARAALEQQNLFEFGLTLTDIRILRTLARRMPKGIGQAELCRALNISLTQFSNMNEPYLRQLGFIEVLNRRVITTQGLLYLVRIGQAEDDQPEVRAVLARQGING